MSGPVAAWLDGGPDGRLHLQHGPIDLIIGVDDGPHPAANLQARRAKAMEIARACFAPVLETLVSELPLLKSRAFSDSPMPEGPVARRMMHAVMRYADTFFITPMAAVAGSVADDVLAAMLSGLAADERPARIYVNNGGDIALHLAGSATFRIGIAREDSQGLGQFEVRSDEPVRGIATSGRGGRSLSMGIADSVTVLAKTAAAADAAASIIGNAVDLPGHPAIVRKPAREVVDDSDLGDLPVVTGCGPLAQADMIRALGRGKAMAEDLISRGLIDRAALFLGPEAMLALPAYPATPRLERKNHA